MLERCGCVPDFNEDHTQLDTEATCSDDTSLECMTRVLDKIGEFRTIPGLDSVCMPACDDQIHSVEITSSVFPNRATFPRRQEQCLLILKLQTVCNTYKEATLSLMYPHLCSNVSLAYQRCQHGQVDPLKPSGLDPRSQAVLEHMLFKYAKENLVVVNVYIKVVNSC